MKSAFPPLAFPDSKILILGTMPGEKSLMLQQYYGNKANQFWKLLFTILNEPFTDDYTIRIELLKKNHIALWDVLASCEREGSLDSKIKNEVVNDFQTFYANHPDIKAVFFSSKAASIYYSKHVKHRLDIQYIILPSPSGANAGKSFVQKLSEWNIIKDFLAT